MTLPLAGEDLTAAKLRSTAGLKYVKTIDKPMTNNQTFSPDSELTSVSLPAGTRWAIDGCMFYTADIAADVKFALSGPAGFTAELVPVSLGLALGAGVEGTIDMGVRNGSTAAGIPGGAAGIATKLGLRFFGTVMIGATAGAVAVNFAQLIAHASTATLYSNSWIRLDRLT